MSQEPTLAALREKIDAVDHAIVELLAGRMRVVAEIAAVKRREGAKIRDPGRERALLDDRVGRAAALGLPAADIDSIFRLVLRASRDHQAALGAEAPPVADPRTVAIVGGKGGMGRLLERLFAGLGHRVLLSDLDTPLAPAEAAAQADVVVVAVPIAATDAVIRAVGPRVREDALLLDITSIKEAPLAAMLAATRASVLGTHPMFGPGVHSLQGQRVVLCPGRGEAWAAWVRAQLTARGLLITEVDAAEHDRAMAIVQVLTHFQTQVHGVTLARLGGPLEASLRFTSPAYLLELVVAARHFAQDPALYGPIEMRNPRAAEVTGAFAAAAREVADVLAAGDQGRFEGLFQEVRRFFGPFTAEALEKSSFLIDRIVERS